MGIKVSDHLNIDDITFSETECLIGYLRMKETSSFSIFLDDIRTSPQAFDMSFETGESLMEYLKAISPLPEGVHIDTLSLDHDLGEGVMDGYDVVKQLCELELPIRRIQLHTDNIIGFKNMFYYLTSAQQHGLLSEETVIEPRKVSVVDGVETLMFRPI